MASPRSPAVPWGLLWGKPGAPVTVRPPLASPQGPAPCLLTIPDLQGPHPGPGRRQREPANRGTRQQGTRQQGTRAVYRVWTGRRGPAWGTGASQAGHWQEHPQRDPGLQGRAAHLGWNPHTLIHTLSHTHVHTVTHTHTHPHILKLTHMVTHTRVCTQPCAHT